MRTGSSLIANLGLSINGASSITLTNLLTSAAIAFGQDAGGNITVAPNTVITLGVAANGSLPGLGDGLIPGVTLDTSTILQLTLNKQVLDGDPLLSPRITTTALEISLLNLGQHLIIGAVAPLVSLDTTGGLNIALAQSQAQLAVPEAGTTLAGVGCLGLVGWMWLKARARRKTS